MRQAYDVRAVCCRRTTILFTLKDRNDNCRNYGGQLRSVVSVPGIPGVVNAGVQHTHNMRYGRCEVRAACGDGRRPKSGHFYCGVGSCNIFGCNCDGGCVPGDPYTEFRKMYGDYVEA